MMKNRALFLSLICAISSWAMFEYEAQPFPYGIERIIGFLADDTVLALADKRPVIMQFNAGKWDELYVINSIDGKILINSAKNKIMVVTSSRTYHYTWHQAQLTWLGSQTIEKACRDDIAWDEKRECLYTVKGSSVERINLTTEHAVCSTLFNLQDNHFFSDTHAQLFFNAQESFLLLAIPNYQQSQLIVYDVKNMREIYNKFNEESFGDCLWHFDRKEFICSLGQSLKVVTFDKNNTFHEVTIPRERYDSPTKLSLHPAGDMLLEARKGDITCFSYEASLWHEGGIVIGNSLQPEGAVLKSGQKMLRAVNALCFDHAGRRLLLSGRDANEYSTAKKVQLYRYDARVVSPVKKYWEGHLLDTDN